MAERCVCCGEIIPEGRQVCPICERKAGAEVMANEKLIRASEAKAKLKAFHDWFGGPVQLQGDLLARKVIEKCIEEIDKLEPVDAMEVVHCGECGYSPDGWVCFGDGNMMPQHPTYPERHCSCGRRRTDNA